MFDPTQVVTVLSTAAVAMAFARCLLLITAGFTAMFSKSSARRTVALRIISMLLVRPWRRVSMKGEPSSANGPDDEAP